MENINKRIEIIEENISEILDKLNSLSIGSMENFDIVRKEDSKSKDDIFYNRNGLIETFEASMLNTDDIADLRTGLEEVYEMLLESEVK